MAQALPIYCFEHCDGKKSFCLSYPTRCSDCGSEIKTSDLKTLPFKVPSPFSDAKSCPCAIVLKPTEGNFLTDYENSKELHVGVTSSFGMVYEYDKEGMHKDLSNQWKSCIPVLSFDKNCQSDSSESWCSFWDFTLETVASQNLWTGEKYTPNEHNCYAFILHFLKTLQLPEVTPYLQDRQMFCEKFMIPKTIRAGKYIKLYRKLNCENTP